MLRRLEFLVPPLLKRIDRQLLLHRPGLWATRIHYLAFYGSILALLMGLYTLIRPMSLQSVPDPDSYSIVLAIPLALGFAIWVYYLTFFRLEKHKGFNWRLNSLRDELLHLGVIGVLAAIPFLFGNQLSDRIDQQISQQELLSDINTLKIGGQFFENRVYAGDHYNDFLAGFQYEHFGLEGELYSYEITQKTPRSSCRKRQLIEDFLFVYHKYTGYTLPLSSREILRNYQDEESIHLHSIREIGGIATLESDPSCQCQNESLHHSGWRIPQGLHLFLLLTLVGSSGLPEDQLAAVFGCGSLGRCLAAILWDVGSAIGCS